MTRLSRCLCMLRVTRFTLHVLNRFASKVDDEAIRHVGFLAQALEAGESCDRYRELALPHLFGQTRELTDLQQNFVGNACHDVTLFTAVAVFQGCDIARPLVDNSRSIVPDEKCRRDEHTHGSTLPNCVERNHPGRQSESLRTHSTGSRISTIIGCPPCTINTSRLRFWLSGGRQ